MARYLIGKLGSSLPSLFLLAVVTFALLRAAPGNFAYAALRDAPTITPQLLHDTEVKYGLDKPVLVQFGNWFGSLLKGDLGRSFYFNQSVWSVLRQRLPVTLELMIGASIIALPLGIATGMLSAITRNSIFDYILRLLVLTGVVLPLFIVAIIILYILLDKFHYSPPLRYTSIISSPSQNIKQFVWPVLLLAVAPCASVSRLSRSQFLEVLREDYVRTARAKGLREYHVLTRHVLKNALPPIFGLVASILGLLISGTVIAEVIFALPGIGSALLLGIQNRDYPLVQGIVLLIGVTFILISTGLDVAIGWLDPRTREAR